MRNIPPLSGNREIEVDQDIKPVHNTNETQPLTNLIANHSLRNYNPASLQNALSSRLIKAKLNEKVSSSSSRLGRDSEEAVSFIHDYNQRLGLSTENLEAKYELMKESPFSLFRAMPALFYLDINGRYESRAALLSRPAPQILINGDPHLLNFGTFRGPDKQAVWGLNDYDQSDIGSPEWDLERLAVSTVLAARNAGLGAQAEKDLVEETGKKYFDTIKDIAKGREEGTPFLNRSEADGKVKDLIDAAEEQKRKDFLNKYVVSSSNKQFRFITNEELRPVSAQRARSIKTALADYEKRLGSEDRVARPLKIIDIAEKLGSGGSSFGLKRYYVLVANDKSSKEPIIIEMKQLLAPSVNDQTGDQSRADGKAMVDRQSSLGGNVNGLTGYARIDGLAYLARELETEKSRLTLEEPNEKKDYKQLTTQAAQVLARAHGSSYENAIKIADWVGKDEKKAVKRLIDFARKYADQVEADYQAFKGPGTI